MDDVRIRVYAKGYYSILILLFIYKYRNAVFQALPRRSRRNHAPRFPAGGGGGGGPRQCRGSAAGSIRCHPVPLAEAAKLLISVLLHTPLLFGNKTRVQNRLYPPHAWLSTVDSRPRISAGFSN